MFDLVGEDEIAILQCKFFCCAVKCNNAVKSIYANTHYGLITVTVNGLFRSKISKAGDIH